jgi:hypothetical protein
MKTYCRQSIWIILPFSLLLISNSYSLIAQEGIDTTEESLIYMSPEDKFEAKKLGLNLPNYQYNDMTTNNHIVQGLYYNTRAKSKAKAGGISLAISALTLGIGLATLYSVDDQKNIGEGFGTFIISLGLGGIGLVSGIISLVTFSQYGVYKSKSKNEIKSANSYKFH